MKCKRFVVVTIVAVLASQAWGESTASQLENLRAREATPAFRRAVVVYQTLREMQENWHNLPSCQPLVEVMDGYQGLIEAAEDPAVAAGALDQALQLTFDMLPQDRALSQLRKLGVTDSIRSRSATFGNASVKRTAGDGAVELRRLYLGALEDKKIVRISFEVRSLTGKAERLALDLRVMNDARNYQTAAFFEVSASGWQRQETTLERMFSQHGIDSEYKVLQGPSLVRATFGTVPQGYGGTPHGDVAFENQFHRNYWVRQGSAQ